MTILWPQAIYLFLTLLGLGILLEQHGKPKTGTHNFWGTAAMTAIINAVLWWGGFYG